MFLDLYIITNSINPWLKQMCLQITNFLSKKIKDDLEMLTGWPASSYFSY